ncbi:hypothetical protein OROGR_012418 [Orobanche gracilis]
MGFHGCAEDFKILDFSLRLFVVPFNVASIWIAVGSHQNDSDYRNLEFSNFIGFKVLAYLMVTSMAALGEFLYLAYNGDQKVSWSRACDSYGTFCSRLKLALATHAMAVCCFLALAVISGYRVFRRFEPPLIPSKECEQQRS